VFAAAHCCVVLRIEVSAVQVDDSSRATFHRGVEPSKSLEDSMLALLSSVDTDALTDHTPMTDASYSWRPSPALSSSYARQGGEGERAHASPQALARRLEEFGSPATDSGRSDVRQADSSTDACAPVRSPLVDWNTPEAIAFAAIDTRARALVGVGEIVSSLKSVPHLGALLGIPQSVICGEDVGEGLERILRAHIGDRLLDADSFSAAFALLRNSWSPHKDAAAATADTDFRASKTHGVQRPLQSVAKREALPSSAMAGRAVGGTTRGNAAGALAAALQDYVGVLGEERREVICCGRCALTAADSQSSCRAGYDGACGSIRPAGE
jgi:hypothetical protein